MRSIVTYDPKTTKLVPKTPQPKIGITAAKFGKHHLLIASVKVSMAKLAYLYHHGVWLSMVTHLDGNKDNYAPDNLTAYRPKGRGNAKANSLTQPIPHAVMLADKSGYLPAFKPPMKPKYPPTRNWVLATAVDGTSLGVYADPEYAKRIARDNLTNIAESDLIKLGVIQRQDIANIDK